MAQSKISSLDETNQNYPTITIAIVGHGVDLINEPLRDDDTNIRIFSRAGQPFCLGIAYENITDFVENLYLSNERRETKNIKSSYQMLREVAEHYNTTEKDTQFKEMCDREIITKPLIIEPFKHTKQNIECKKHNNIYTPTYDHKYFFTDNNPPFAGQNQICVLETINHTSISNINYNAGTNLAMEKYFIKHSDITDRKLLYENIINKFLKKFNLEPDLETDLSSEYKKNLEVLKSKYPPQYVSLDPRIKEELDAKINALLLNSKLTRYSNNIFENIPFVNLAKIINDFNNETSEIHRLVNEKDDSIITEKCKEMSFKDVEDREMRKNIRNLRINFMKPESDNLLNKSINLSEIIAFLKSEGFVIINIIDFTCRYVPNYLDDAYIESELPEDKIKRDKKLESIREYQENQAMGSESILINKGGRKNRKTKRKKSKKGRKSRINKNKSKN